MNGSHLRTAHLINFFHSVKITGPHPPRVGLEQRPVVRIVAPDSIMMRCSADQEAFRVLVDSIVHRGSIQ